MGFWCILSHGIRICDLFLFRFPMRSQVTTSTGLALRHLIQECKNYLRTSFITVFSLLKAQKLCTAKRPLLSIHFNLIDFTIKICNKKCMWIRGRSILKAYYLQQADVFLGHPVYPVAACEKLQKRPVVPKNHPLFLFFLEFVSFP